MQIDMQSRDLPLTPPIQDYIRRRLSFALGSQYESIRHITVRLSDINGPRGGTDMRCQILIKLNSKAEVVIEDTQSQIRVAIDRAASRASRTVTRKVARIREKAINAPDFSASPSSEQSKAYIDKLLNDDVEFYFNTAPKQGVEQ
ncbi:HPF/RaiA family ribosome-associated protein [Corallincola holothuriorum]|uniref:HPF/RaiA family ribosome-associated protein n=1 Tax=Corallincola holothuriorum TaxID=2282215 RepID=A0A368NL26_9GAMM|nr:HPF/RaiA family ribosome-associated protein [Corallincola holothuriorum]RCU50866.1 HPF/RaiA family ribosome-associated protein [Corallincola holothuriorum]